MTGNSEGARHESGSSGLCPVSSGLAPPPRFKPPSTSTSDRSLDRSPRDGYAGVISFGEIAAGTGSFIRYAKALGMKCRWFSEVDTDLHAAASNEAGPEAQAFGDLLQLHPDDLPAVDLQNDFFLLIGGPECQPFSRAGARQGLYDRRARTLLWIVWCLAVRQFQGAFVENVAHLLYISKGKVYGTLVSVLEGIGYTAVTAVDCPLRHGVPHSRERAFISILRSDLVDRWGPPVALPRPQDRHSRFEDQGAHAHGETFVPIEKLLLPPSHPAVVAEFEAFALVLVESALGAGADPQFVEPDAEQAKRYPRKPMVAWKCGNGGFGCLGYTVAVPAIKVKGDGP